MICKKCGQNILEDFNHCPNCGACIILENEEINEKRSYNRKLNNYNKDENKGYNKRLKTYNTDINFNYSKEMNDYNNTNSIYNRNRYDTNSNKESDSGSVYNDLNNNNKYDISNNSEFIKKDINYNRSDNNTYINNKDEIFKFDKWQNYNASETVKKTKTLSKEDLKNKKATILVISALVILFIIIFANVMSEKVTYSHYLEIHEDMSISEVCDILGEPNYTTTYNNYYHLGKYYKAIKYDWVEDDKRITVIFINDKVVYIQQNGLN
jgi:hypothetical protein